MSGSPMSTTITCATSPSTVRSGSSTLSSDGDLVGVVAVDRERPGAQVLASGEVAVEVGRLRHAGHHDLGGLRRVVEPVGPAQPADAVDRHPAVLAVGLLDHLLERGELVGERELDGVRRVRRVAARHRDRQRAAADLLRVGPGSTEGVGTPPRHCWSVTSVSVGRGLGGRRGGGRRRRWASSGPSSVARSVAVSVALLAVAGVGVVVVVTGQGAVAEEPADAQPDQGEHRRRPRAGPSGRSRASRRRCRREAPPRGGCWP